MYDGKRYLLEVNIFDFDQEIYGQVIEIEFLQKLRDEKIFSSEQALIEEMHRDAQKARNFSLK
jgi:riboflavin kinase/FMN adenylyltransferase